jgi:chromosome segregation ATPase
MPGPTVSEARVARLVRPSSSRDDELLNLRSTVQHLETSLARHSECCERITGEIATVREEALRISRTEVEKRECEIVRKLSEKIIASAETHRSEITLVDERLNGRLSDQNTLLQAVHSTGKKINRQNDDLRNELADTASRTTENSKGIEQLHAVVAQQGSHRSSLEALDTRSSKAMGDLSARLDTHQNRIDQVDARSLDKTDKTDRLGVELQAVKVQYDSHQSFLEALDTRSSKAMGDLSARLDTHQNRVDQVDARSLNKTDKLDVELQAVKVQQDSYQTRLEQGDTRSLNTQKRQEKLEEQITALELKVDSLVKQQQESAKLEVTVENTVGAAEIPKAAEVKQPASDTYYDEPSGGLLTYFRFSRKPTTEQKEKLKSGQLFNFKERHDAGSVGGYVMYP